MIRNEDLIPHMRGVLSTERDLRDLAVMWQMIESSASISCPEEVAPILPTLVVTRERFNQLQSRLVGQMVLENQDELGDELQAKAQCAIDILVRNLFERTADVGFLATDETVCRFCAQPQGDAPTRAQMVARLAAYQAKYTVYDDIILLGPQGQVLARLDEKNALTASLDTIVSQALQAGSHVERFGASDLGATGATGAPSLLYAHRIAAPAQGGQGQPWVGVLVLRFRFADEMQRIFRSIHDEDIDQAIVLIDETQRVIATNEEAQVPTATVLRRLAGSDMALTAFAGREYVAVCRGSAGYQGYRGPAWRAQTMASLSTAFRQRGVGSTAGDSLPLDNTELVAMSHEADAINRELRRVVWNGRLMAGDRHDDRSRLKAVLQQINAAGMRTRERVAEAILDICRTSLARARRQTRSLARLASDIMDRNLYERANDCRWWALSPALLSGLASPAGEANAQALGQVLDHINGLYTVYSRLVVFDAAGAVRGASKDATCSLAGSPVPAAWVAAVERLGDDQRYAVTPFEDTTLHDAGPTYVYLAALRAPGGNAQVQGGIAIVFHAAVELQAMLRDVLAGREGFAAFVDAQGRVLASTDPELASALVGTCAQSGETALVDHAGAHYACAQDRAAGYREFKTSDGYDNGVRTVVGLRLGGSERRGRQLGDSSLQMAAAAGRQQTVEAAVFQVGGSRYALPTHALLLAVSPQGLVRTPGSDGLHLGMVEVPEGRGTRLVQTLCARRLFGVSYPARAGDGALLVLRHPSRPEAPACTLRVDDVLAVLDVPCELLQPVPRAFARFAPWVSSLFQCLAVSAGQQEQIMVQMLDPASLLGVALPDLNPGGAQEQPAVASARDELADSAINA